MSQALTNNTDTGLIVSSSPGTGTATPPTTTISTIAVQAGTARIVIALLQSKEWLQLKILEMEPDLAKIGTNLEEAQEYQRQHEDVLRKLQGKQSPVEELLNQADQLISTQKPRAEVYAAMAESLGLAWRDLNNQLEHRKQLLEQSVAFHLRSQEFSDRLDKGEKDCEDNLLPSDPDAVRKLLQQHHDMKKGILEASMHTLNEGQILLERLKEVAALGTGDSRPGHLRQTANTAIYQVEHLMESLHDRRRRLEDLWAKRKLILEQCLQLCLLQSDIARVHQWLQTKGQEYAKANSLGDSTASAEILQHEHSKAETDVKQVQDRSIRLLRTAEQLRSGGHYAGPEVENQAYQLLEAMTEVTGKVDQRLRMLAMAVAFFRGAQSALTKLDQIEVQLSTSDLSRGSATLAQQHAQIAQTIDEIVGPALHDGYLVLNSTGRDNPGVQGVARTVAELEERRKKLNDQCSAHRAENLQKSAAVKAFQNTFNHLYTWIVSNGEAFLQGHQDMGSVLAMAKDFLQRHEQLLKDVLNKGPELEAVFRSFPNLLKSAPEDAPEIEDQIDKLRTVWVKVNTTLENRIQLARLYVNFHRLAVQLANDMDALEALIVAIRDGHQVATDATASDIEERWLNISQTYLQLKNTGKNFIFDAKKSKDPYLDIQRAILCVETLLEHFQGRQLQLANLRENWQSNVSQDREIRTQWEKYVTEVRKTIQWITTFQIDLYPVITGDVMNVQSIIWDLERKMSNFVPLAKKAQAEIEQQVKSSEALVLKGNTQSEKDQALSQLSGVSQELNTHITEYQILLSMLIAYFKKVHEIEKMVEKLEMQYVASLLPTEVSAVEVLLTEHEASRQAVLELFRFSSNERTEIATKIRNQEPPAAASQDEEKLNKVLELIQQHWEKAWMEHKRHLEQHLQLCQFNQDLKQINNQLNELSTQLSSIRGNYGESLPAARATSQAFVQFEKTIELLEHRIRVFVSTAEKMLSDDHLEKQHIRYEIAELQNKWSSFHRQVGENRKLIDLSIDYFKLVEEAEEWFKEGSKLLIQIARKSTSCRTPQEANNLLNEVEVFLKPGEMKQNERLRKISTLAIQIYGQSTPVKVDSVSIKNREMLESFTVINEELKTLANNLRTAEQEREKHLREKEEVDAALLSAKAEAAAAKAAAAAAEEARKAAEAAARAVPPTRVIEKLELRTVQRAEAIPVFPDQSEPPPPQRPLSPPVLLDKKPRHVAPQFIITLHDAEVLEGTKFKFECRVTGFPAPDVQWYKDGIAITNNPDYQTSYDPERGHCILTIEETFSEDSAKFTCKAGNAAGIVETHGQLTVKEARVAEEYLAPDFTKELKPATVKVGEAHQFECHVTGNPLPVVTWLKNDLCIDTSPDYVITYNNGICLLRLDQIRATDDAKYTCRASNQVGVASSTAKLTVEPAEPVESPSFPQPLSNVMARAGQKLRLECCVRGLPEPQVTWLHNNRPVKETRDAKITLEDGKAMLTIPEAFPKDAGTYVVVAKNRAGEATTSCTVTVKGRLPLETSDSELASDLEPVKPRILQMLKDITAPEHSKVRMDCIIVGQPEPEVIWYHDGIPVKESNDFQLLFEGDKCSLIIREAYVEDAGEYRVVAINSAGEASSLCTLYIKPLKETEKVATSQKFILISEEKGTAPKFTRLLVDTTANEGDGVLLECSVTGEPKPIITWYRDDKEIATSNICQISQGPSGKQTLKIPKVVSAQAGMYTVRASNMAGEAKCFCHVTVNPSWVTTRVVPTKILSHTIAESKPPPPLFQKLFTDQTVKAGQPVKFECVIIGQPKVHWLFNGEPLTAEDFTISMEDDKYALYIPAIKPENAGRYTATAENDQGKATCSAQLRVSEPAELIVPIDLDDVDGSMEKSYKMSSVFKSTTTMQKTYSSNTSQVYGSNGNVEFHRIASEEEHAMKKVGDQPAQESHTSKKEEIHRTEPLASLVIKQSTKALEGSGQVLESAASQFQSMVSTSKTNIAPKFTKPITSIVCNAGEKAQFIGHIEGYPEPSIKWYKNGAEMFRADYPCTFDKGVATMTIPRAVEKDSGRYTCTARNATGTASSTADLVVKAMSIAPQFVKSLQAQVVKAGTRVEMTVEVSGVPDPDISWFKNGQPLSKAGFRRITKHDNTSTLVIMQAQPEDSGKYMVKAVNPAGEANSVVDFVVEQDQLPSQVKTTFSSKKVTIFEEKKQTVSRVSTLSPEPITLPEKTEKVEYTTISPSPTTEEKAKAVTEAPPTTSPKTETKPTLPEYAAPSAKRFKPVKVTKPEKATIELSVQVEETPKPMETTEASMVPTKEEKVRVPPPPPPKPSPKSKQVFSESEDEFVRKELTFEPPKSKQMVTSPPPPSKIPIYSPPPLATPSKFVPISESPIPSSGCEDEPLQPTVWKPGGEQPVSATWRPVKPPSSTGTPVKALVPSHDGPPEQPMTMFQKSMHIKEETTTTTTIRKEILSPKTVTFPELKGHSPPMPEPGPPPEFGYVDPKSVQRPVRTVVPPPPPTPTSMPKGGVPVYPGMPDAGCYTPPIGASSHMPVFPKVATVADVRTVPLRPGTPPEMGFISPVTTSSSTRVTEESTTTTVTSVKESTPLLQRGSPPEVGYVPLAPVVSPVPTEERLSTAMQFETFPAVWKPNIDSSSAPVFVKPLQDKVVNEGEPVVFECIVQGDPTPNIHWYRDGQELPPLPDVQTRFQYNVCQLSIPKAIMLEHPCTISCVASNTSGSATTTAALRIKVQGMVIQSPTPSKPSGSAPPTFEKVPQNCRFVQGGNANFELKVKGNPKPQVKWTRRGTPLTNSAKYAVKYDDNTGISSLQINQLQKEDEGEYTCTASNQFGEAVCNVLIQSDMAPTTQRQFQQQGVTSTYRQTRTVERKVGGTIIGTQTVDRRVTQKYEFDGSPVYYTNGTDEGFKVDTFEYRLLREIDFREAKTKRHPGETETETETDKEEAAGPTAPPQLLQRLRNSKLLEGSDATFQAKLTGNPKPRITWFKNGQRIVASQRCTITFKQQTATLHIHMALPEDAGHYTLLAENPAGRVACSAQLVIEAIGTQDELQFSQRYDQLDGVAHQRIPAYTAASEPPESEQTVKSLRPNFAKVPGDKEVTEGKMVRFDCRVTGRPYPEVFWYLNSRPILDDNTHKLIVNEAGNHSLLITIAQRTDAGTYTCIARNKGGEASFQLNLTVIEKEQVVAPKFVERFQTMHIREGEPVSLHCRAVGTPIPHITWQKDGIQIHSTPECTIQTDGGSSSLHIRQLKASDSAWYQCTAQNIAGSTATRARLYVEVEQLPIPEPWRLSLPRPTKVIQPEGSPEREVIWLRHVERAQHYRSHPEEEPRVSTKPMFTHPLKNLEDIQEGDRAHFEARLIPIGDPAMQVEWYFNGRPLPASSRFMTSYRFGYVSLTILHVYSQDQGIYTCRAVNELGEDVTSSKLTVIARARVEYTSQHPESMDKIQQLEEWERYYRRTISVEEPPQKPTFVQQLRNLTDLQEGQYAHLEAKVTPLSDPTMKIEWYFNNKPLTASSRITTIYSFGYVALNIMHLRIEDSGTYTCRAINRAGEAISTATVTVTVRISGVVTDTGIQEQRRYIEKTEELEAYQKTARRDYTEEPVVSRKPEFKTQIKDQINVMEGQSAHFEAMLEPIGDSTMKVEWIKNGQPLEASSRITTYFNFGYVALTIKTINEYDVGVYVCRATNKLGTDTTKAKLTVITKGNVIIDSQHPEGLEKIRHLEDTSKYTRKVVEETVIKQLPRFTVPLQGNNKLVEGQAGHFEARLEPTNDPTMKVEWFLNGKPLQSAHRYKTYFDFGYVALDILYVFPEDTGLYSVKATNSMGTATQTSELFVKAKKAIDTSAIHKVGLEKIQQLEDSHFYLPHYDIEEISKTKPIFKVPLADPGPLKEGQHIHLECRLEPIGDPTMRVEWFFNGRPLTIGSRFKPLFDFGYVALDITNAYPEDSGEYTVRATNHLGSAHTSSCITITGIQSIDYQTQHPAGLEAIHALEDTSRYQRKVHEDRVISQMPTFVKPLHSVEVVEGSNVHLECRLQPVGDVTMKVEWLVNGRPVPTGHRFKPVYDFDYVALDILTAYPEDSGVYNCRAVNKMGEAVTSASIRVIAKKAIILESQHPEGLEQIQYLEDTASRHQREMWTEEVVKVHPRFLTKFKDLENLREGQNAHFECRLEPITDPNLKVEWFKNGKSLTIGHRFRPIHDFGYVALDILGVVEEDSGTYTCRATNMVGSEEMSVKLSVKGSSEVDTQCQHPEGLQKIHHLEDSSKYIREEIHEEVSTQAPVFTSSIQNITIKEGQRAHFECRLIPVSDPNLKVEWFHNGRPVKSGSRFVETHNFGFVALDILTAYPEDGGTYTCKATNPLGSAVTSAILVCTAKKSVYLETQHEGSMAKIQQLEDTSKYYRSPYLEDVTTQSPVFTQAMKDLRLFENQSAHFECRLIPVGDPKLKVEWFRNGIPLETGTRITTMHDFGFVSLDFKYVRPEDSGTYTCKATNELGSAVTTATMVVQGKGSLMLDTQHPEGLEKIRYLEDTSRYHRTEYEDTIVTMGPKFVTPLTGPTELNEGQSSHYECRIEPHTDPNLKVEWFFNGNPLQTRHRFMTMFDFGFAALDILSMIAEDSGEYSIKATNKLGTAVSSIRVRVTGKGGLILESQHPEGLEKIALLEDDSRYKREMFVEAPITAKPQFERGLRNLEHLLEGESAHLECSVIPTNDPSMKVEWFFNGRPIPTGHRFRTTYDFGYIALDILYVYPEDTGTYMCKATNANGEAITTCHIQVEAIKKIHTETLHEEGLKKIQALESQYIPEKEEIPFVSKRPEFIVPLVSLHNLKEGDRLHLECRLEPINDPKLRVEWFINGIEIKKAHRFRMTHDFGYVALDLLYAYPEDSGTFMCKATNDLGEAVTTCSVQIQSLRKIFFETQHPEGWEKIQELEAQPKYEPIEVEERPITKPLIISPLMGTTDLMEGQRAHLECRVEPVHDPQLTIEFTHNGKPLPAASRFHITFDFGYIALDISHVFPEDAGEYVVTAKNKLGQASSSIIIRVKAKSSIISDTQHPEGLEKIRELEDESRYLKPEFVEPRTTQRPVFTVPLMNLDLSEHDAAHLECRLIPVGDPTLKVEWFFNEKPLSKSSRFMTVHDFGYVALDISYVRPDDTGVYMCRASNELGEAVTTASLRIRTKANILYDTANPEGLQKIHELEDGKNYRPPEAPEKPFDKPVFTAALTGPRELMEGQRALFECRVTPVGDPNLKFEWYINGIELQKGTRFKPTHDFGMVTLEIASVIPEDSGVYMCKASNLAGEAVTSTSMRVRPRHGVLLDTFHEEGLRKTQQFEYDASCIPEQWAEEAPSQPPRFTQHLTSLEHVFEDNSINLRGNVVPATDPKLKVEWYKNGKPLDLGTRMRTVLDFGLVTCDISGARPDDSGIYTCRAYNDVGEAISTCTVRVTGRHWIDDQTQNPAALEKIRQLEEPKFDDRMPDDEAEFDSPVFISHLNNVELHEGDDAHFACRIQPARDKTMKIEFYFNGQLIPLATRYTVTCEFGYVTLVITGCNLDDAGVYMCKATNAKGQAMSAGTLKVHTRGGNVFYETTHPMGEAGLEKVREAEAAYLAKYQQVDTEAEIVYPKPTFIVPLQANFVVNEAEPLQMECRVEPAPDPNLIVEWFFNGKPLDTATRFTVLFEFGHVVMNVTDLWPRDCGIYTCRARNRAGEAFTTTTIRVIAKKSIYEETTHPKGQEGLEAIEDLEESLRHVEGALPEEEGHPPVFTSQFENLTNLNEGDIAHFEASLTPAGDQTMVVEWFFKNQPLKAGHRIRTVHAFGMVVLEILGVYVEDSGEYTCRATNRWGRAEITVRLECIDLSRGQKPHFTTHIQSLVNLNEGQSAHFECHLIPVGDPTMVVEWFHNGRPLRHSSRIKTLSDFGYVVLDIAFVHPEDSGEYVCKATNKYGDDTTRAVIQCRGRGTLFFDSLQPQSLERIAELEGAKYTTQAYIEGEPNQPPHFVNHLTNVEHLIEGQSAHFEASLTPVNDPDLKVTWYFNGKKLQHGHRFRTFHDFGIVILDILYCYEEDSGVYEARAKNRYGRDVTKATLTCSSKKSLIFDTQLPASMEGGLEKIRSLDDPYYRVRREVPMDSGRQAPVFTVPLQNATDLRESENAHLEARLIPVDDPTLTVEWFRNGRSIKTGSRIRTIHDFGFVVLELSPVYPEDSGEYSCRAKNELGEAVTTCILKCEGKRGVILETQLPKGMETGVEKIAQLESYSDKFIAETWMDVDESKPPKFVSQPQDLNLMENSLAHFECQLIPVGDPSLKVEWFHNGKPLTAGSRVKTIHDFGFVILEVSNVYQRDAGLYTCKASNKHGEASVSVKLSVKGRLGVIMEPQLPSDFKSGTESIQKLEESLHQKDETVAEEEVPRPPVFITQIQDQDKLNEGEPAHFECRVEPVGDASMKIEWFHNGRPLDTGSRIHYLDDFGFIVLDYDWTFPRDSGEYVCRATNLWGTAITKAKLVCKGKRDIIVESQLPQGMSADRLRDLECPPAYVAPAEDTPLQPPKFTTQIQPLEDLQEGDSAHFECRLIPVNDPKLKVEWFHNGKPLMSGHRFKTTHDFDFVALDILYAYAEDSGEYMAHASNDLGEDKTKAHLQCKGGMSIILYNQMPKGMKKSEAVVQMEAALRKYTKEIHLTEKDIFDPDKKQPPKFITQIRSRTDLKEFEPAKFECQLSPVGDPHMKVEWFFNGRQLAYKNRFNPIYDFGYVALDFGWVYPEDSGEYICRATNLYGTDETRAVLKSTGEPNIVYESQLPKEMGSSTLRRIREIESAWIKVPDEEEEEHRERSPPQFIIMLEPETVNEGEWAKFFCRVTGFPKARVLWLLNGHAVPNGSRYKLWYDGMYRLDIPKTRQYDAGKVEVIAKNSLGEARCSTILEVRPRHDDYRALLKNSPRPWYDTDLKRYQDDRFECELDRKFEESLSRVHSQVYHTVDSGQHEHKVTPIDRSNEQSELALAFKKRRMDSEAYYKNLEGGGSPDQRHITIVKDMAETYESNIDDQGKGKKVRPKAKFRDTQYVQVPRDPHETSVHGKEIHTQRQTQTQKEMHGDTEVTRKTTVTETVEQEHKGTTKERIVKGPVPETKPPIFTKKLQPCRTFEKESGRFECEFSGVPPPNITWYRENFPIKSSPDFQITTTDKKSILVIKEVYMEDSGVFSVIAENRGGTAKSTSNLVVEERKERRKGGVVPPSFTVTMQDVHVQAGQLVRLDAKVSGSKPLDVYWLKGNKKVLPDIRYKMLEEDDVYTLLIIEAFAEDAGVYDCVAINQGGEARCQAQVQVEVPSPKPQRGARAAPQAKPDIKGPSILEPIKDQTVTEGQRAVFTFRASAHPAPTVKWFRGNNLVKQSRYFRMSEEGDRYTLTISEAFPEDEGTYKCVLSNTAGTLTLSAHLTVLVPESATTPPTVKQMTNVAVREGQPARFITEVSGTPTPTVQWFREGVQIPQSTDFQMSQEGTRCTLLIANTYVEDSGRYTCRATNPSGQVEASAHLRVESKR